jgi:uncharacterized membrane protein
VSEAPIQRETTRVEAFSDGVFAIAITLLILDIKVPAPDAVVSGQIAHADRWLLGALGRQWPGYVAYFTSFAVILVMWVNHHRIFSLLRKTDHPFLFWNGLLLMLISIVPFPTSLLATYFMTPAAKVAAGVYAGHGILIALAFQGVWRHAIRNERLLMPGTKAEVAFLSAQYRFGPLMYVIAFGLAFVSASISVGLCLSFAVFFSLQGFTQKGDA